jgi:GTP-binding protein
VIVVNKMDSEKAKNNWSEFVQIAGVKMIGVSAKNGQGVGDLLDWLIKKWPISRMRPVEEKQAIYVSVVGRPNAGKSSLINLIAGQERMVVSQTPGTTRDIGEIEVKFGREKVIFYDTAGIRSRRIMSRDKIEKYSYLRALRAMENSQVVVLMIDATEGAGKTEMKLAGLVEEMGKGLLIFVNKLDLAQDNDDAVGAIIQDLRQVIGYIDWVPVIVGSVKENLNIKPLIKNIVKVGENCQSEIKQSVLSDLVMQIRSKYRLPEIDLQRIKQVGVNPPTFLLGNIKKNPSPQTIRMLTGLLRDVLELIGVPIRLEFK